MIKYRVLQPLLLFVMNLTSILYSIVCLLFFFPITILYAIFLKNQKFLDWTGLWCDSIPEIPDLKNEYNTLTIKQQIEDIEKEEERVRKLAEQKEDQWDVSRFIKNEDGTMDYAKEWMEFEKYMKPLWNELNELNRKKRMILPCELVRDIPKHGDVMSLKQFIKCVKEGGFIDYDGFGYYVKDKKVTNIKIYPSDIKHNAVRKEFKEIIWFNK